MVLAYPWFGTRLWLPLIPLLMNYFYTGLSRTFTPQIIKPLIWGHCLSFAILGLLAFAYSTRLTFAGQNFSELYGDGRHSSDSLKRLIGCTVP